MSNSVSQPDGSILQGHKIEIVGFSQIFSFLKFIGCLKEFCYPYFCTSTKLLIHINLNLNYFEWLKIKLRAYKCYQDKMLHEKLRAYIS